MATSAKSSATYESALAEVETIVETLESGDLTLEEMVSFYEKGIGLLKICQTRLQEASLRIEKLKSLSLPAETEPFAPEDTEN